MVLEWLVVGFMAGIGPWAIERPEEPFCAFAGFRRASRGLTDIVLVQMLSLWDGVG